MAKNTESAYAKAGVNIGQAEEAVRRIKKHVQSTYNQHVLSGIGAFGGLFDASIIKSMENPVLVQSIDGVGTKMMIAEMMDQWTVGQCIVYHCINDTLVSGAQPITFLNYVGAAKLKPKTTEKIVENMAIACKEEGIPIISGETAEMPSVYCKGRHDVVGSITGIVERSKILDGSEISEEDVLIGLPSNGLHTNGYSLVRKAFFETRPLNVHAYVPELGCTIGEELLKIHKCYFKKVFPLLGELAIEIHGIAHITGGGLIDNIARLLPKGLCAEISEKWKIPPVFQLIQEIEKVSKQEMRRVFNLGIGMVLIVPSSDVEIVRSTLTTCGEPTIIIGTIKKTRSKKGKRVFFTY